MLQANIFGSPVSFISGKENKNKVLRGKYVLAPFSRSIFFIQQGEETYLRKRLKLKYPVENMCSRHFQGVF